VNEARTQVQLTSGKSRSRLRILPLLRRTNPVHKSMWLVLVLLLLHRSYLASFVLQRVEPRLRKALKEQQRPRPRYYVRGQTSPDVERPTDVSSPANINNKVDFFSSLFSFPFFFVFFSFLSEYTYWFLEKKLAFSFFHVFFEC
jgi:hypothetical protein